MQVLQLLSFGQIGVYGLSPENSFGVWGGRCGERNCRFGTSCESGKNDGTELGVLGLGCSKQAAVA